MSVYVRKAAIKRLAKESGKWVGANYFVYLDKKIEEIVRRGIHSLGSRTILNAGDAEAYDQVVRKINASV